MTADSLSRTFAALAHPARRKMLARLSRGEASVQELAKPFKMSQPAVSKHVKVLEQSGLIKRSRSGQWRPCHLEVQPMREATDWMDQHRQEWEGRFKRLEALLERLQKAPATHKD